MNTCPTCHTRFTPGKHRNQFCSNSCAQAHRTAPYLDLLDLIALGEAPLSAAARLGIRAQNAARWMYRHGHVDLARHFHKKGPSYG